EEGGTASATPSSSSAGESSPVDNVMVMDGFAVVRPDAATRVDLSAFVRGRGAALTRLRSVQPQCDAARLAGLTAEVTVTQGGVCQYAVDASNGARTGTGTLSVLASNHPAPVLPPLTQAIVLGQPATFELPALLGADWPTGYELDSASLQVQGGSVQGRVTARANTLHYTPPATPDWNRIVFILKHPAKPAQDRLGALYVTVADTVNQPPVIGQPRYDYQVRMGQPLETRRDYTLDLGTLAQLDIRKPDGGVWQLVAVQSYSAAVGVVDPDTGTSKQLTFRTDTVGPHIVSYIVGDRNGGFAMGQLRLAVGPLERVPDLADISVDEWTFFAPPRYSDALARGVTPAEAVWDPSVNKDARPPGNTVAGLTGEQAWAYCGAGGWRLPTEAQLNVLFRSAAAAAARAEYPSQRAYLVSNDGGVSFRRFNLDNGGTDQYDLATRHRGEYVICVKHAQDGALSYLPTADTPLRGVRNTAIADGTWQKLGDVVSDGGVHNWVVVTTSDRGAGRLGAANVRLVPADCIGSRCTLEVKAAEQEYGDIRVRLYNAKDPGRALDIGPLTVWRNATLASVRVGARRKKPPADGNSANTVIARLTDRRGNPLPPGTRVRLKYTVTPNHKVTVTPASGSVFTTDNDSEVVVEVRYQNYLGGKVTVTWAPVGDGIPSADQAVTTEFDNILPDLSKGCNVNSSRVTKTGLVYVNDKYSLTCPVLRSEADRLGIPYIRQSAFFDHKYPMMTFNQAKSYCANMGGRARLVDRDGMLAVYELFGSPKSFGELGWPADSYRYWTLEDNGLAVGRYQPESNRGVTLGEEYKRDDLTRGYLAVCRL
ncbi:Ig-like domain-containing protein, partial [Aeromonas hydrophila]|uniref:Ig-like domain-containing protein n=1 Tax=Aeromonas hydrophila TaxID=644 RepID=UPI0035BB60E3